MNLNSAKSQQGNGEKKDSFWEKISKHGHKNGLIKNSLVDTIISQAEKESGNNTDSDIGSENEKIASKNAQHSLLKLLKLSKTVLTLTVFLVLLAYGYLFANLNEKNYIFSSFGKQNLTSQFNYKTQLLNQLRRDSVDTKKFSKLLKVENLSSRITALDLENPVLNYKTPKLEKVSSDNGENVYRTTDASGKIIYLKEADVRKLEDAQKVMSEYAKSSLKNILEEATALKQETMTTEIDTELNDLLAALDQINPEENNFPSAATKEHYDVAQSSAAKIMIRVKDLNLNNLVADIKKQAEAIDVSNAGTNSQAAVEKLKTILQKLNANRASSFDQALKEAESLDKTSIDDNIYKKIVSIIGDPENNEPGDLQSAATIAKNLGKINIINTLQSQRIVWSSVIDRAEKIARLGADMERDLGKDKPKDARADLDPDGKLITFSGYSASKRKNAIEVRGMVASSAEQQNKGFSILANLIDAFEGSRYFQNVDGFSFSKSEDTGGKTIVPFNLNLELQNVGTKNSLDIEMPLSRSRQDKTAEGDLKEVQKLNFSETTKDKNQ